MSYSLPPKKTTVSLTMDQATKAPLDFILEQYPLDPKRITQKVLEERERFKRAVENYRGVTSGFTIKM
jgi:hypothetical protein